MIPNGTPDILAACGDIAAYLRGTIKDACDLNEVGVVISLAHALAGIEGVILTLSEEREEGAEA